MGVLALGVHQAHGLHPGRAEGVGDVLAGVLRPADHVDLFAAQFVHHLLDAGAAGADAGPHRIHFPLHAVHGHLGAGAHRAGGRIGFPGHGHDPHGALLDLGHLVLEQIHHQASVGAAHEQLWPAAGYLAHLLEEHLEGGVGAVVVVGQLIPAGQFGLHFRTA